jgi:hypothetical protein
MVDIHVADAGFEHSVWQSNVRGISDRSNPYAALGVPRDLGRSASDGGGDLEAKELPRRTRHRRPFLPKNVRPSAVLRSQQASNSANTLRHRECGT